MLEIGYFGGQMEKRSAFSWLMILAFAVSLVHSVIPHGHPPIKQQDVQVEDAHANHSHQHTSTGDSHHSRAAHHHHHHKDESLPVFVHFSNADFVGASSFHFSASEKFLVESICFPELCVATPEQAIRQVNIPRARDLPADPLHASGSLRAPPFFS